MYEFDDSRRPLYVIKMSGRLTRADVESMGRDVVAMLETRATYGNAWDLTRLEFPKREIIAPALTVSKQTSSLAHDLYQHPSDAPPVFAAFAMGPRITKLVQFFHRMSPRALAPPNVFATFEEALAATERQLETFGIRVPPRAP